MMVEIVSAGKRGVFACLAANISKIYDMDIIRKRFKYNDSGKSDQGSSVAQSGGYSV